MSQGSRLRFFFWIFGITFVVVMVIQFIQIPNGKILSSLVSSEKRNIGTRKDSSYSIYAGIPINTYSIDDVTVEGGLETKSPMENSWTPKTNDSVESVMGKKEIHEFSSSTVSSKSLGPAPKSLTTALAPAIHDFVNPAESLDPGFSLVRNDTGSKFKKDVEQIPTKRNSALTHNISPQSDNSSLHKLSISEMTELLLKSHSFPNIEPPKWYSSSDQELIYAKSHILNAKTVENAAGLQAPIYRNVSMFQRSYELMEKILKIYIYKEGERPIFHDSILEGIYASEGWFLKLLESNKQYLTKDPAKAHLFYLPFSSRLLQLTLYKRHSHSRDNLIKYMRDYVDMLAQKYPFWNRTDGHDHFLAACHDWAPAETRGPLSNSLRALCNADIRVGFEIGKDVSLPTKYIRSAQNPLKDIGGEPPSQRTILAFFAGYMHGYVRPVLLNYWGKDSDMRIFDRMPHVKGDNNYIQNMKSSKYCICARGYAVHSPRVMESIFYECVPVIISDEYVPPLFEVLNWESFAVFISEKDIPNLKQILLSISMDKYIEMHKCVKEVQKHFLWHIDPVKYDLFHMILHSVWYNRVFQIQYSP